MFFVDKKAKVEYGEYPKHLDNYSKVKDIYREAYRYTGWSGGSIYYYPSSHYALTPGYMTYDVGELRRAKEMTKGFSGHEYTVTNYTGSFIFIRQARGCTRLYSKKVIDILFNQNKFVGGSYRYDDVSREKLSNLPKFYKKMFLKFIL